jgi:serine phosphatase RsbU (regulator of sigma subunit)/anti-sigma regulatory factor (Ser/Thr protein kinase)
LHALAVPLYALLRSLPARHIVLESIALPIAALAASYPRLPRRVRTLVAAAGLLTASGLLVHLSGGLIEMHFHFFVMVVVVSLYQDWIPFIAAIGYVLLHHGVVGVLDPRSVYNHPAAINNPWKWALIHALFIAGISATSLVAWRLNETLLSQRRKAERLLQEEAHVGRTLSEVAAILAGDRDLSRVVQHVIDAATERIAGQFGAFFYSVVDEAGKSILLHALARTPEEAPDGLPSPPTTTVFAPRLSDLSVLRVDDITKDPRYAENPQCFGVPEGTTPVRSYMAVPVQSRGEIIGGLFFGHTDTGHFSEVAERIAVGIAAHAAIAIDNAKLYEAEVRTRRQEEQARNRLAIVAEASRLLSTSLEHDAILRNLGNLLVPAVADNCVIDLVQDDGTLRRAHLAIEPRAAEASERIGVEPPGPRADDHPAVRVIRSGKSLLVEDVPADAISQVIEGRQFQELATQLEPRSAAVVPINGREGVIGALTLATTAASGRRLNTEDIKLLEEIARRTATAIDIAQRYESKREAAETLQQSLLPARLPQLPALSFAAHYSPGKSGTEVGGDWYDVVAVPYGGIGLVMGDVVGRGIAAASLMGQIRNALRAYAFREPDPGIVLEQLNALFSGWSAIDQMATLLYAIFDIETGEVRIANAGHPPPVIRKENGTAIVIEGARGTPLGATTGATYQTSSISLEPGDTVLLYTDGLVEDRHVSLDQGIEVLERAASAPIEDLRSFCTHLVEEATAGRTVDDDVALLAMQYTPFGDEVRLTLPTDPWILRPLRSAMRRWLIEAGATPEEAFKVLVATTEACANAIRHPAGPRKRKFELNAERNGRIHIEVKDSGRWRPSNGLRSGGRGLKLISDLVDEVRITKGPPETIVSMNHGLASAKVPK